MGAVPEVGTGAAHFRFMDDQTANAAPPEEKPDEDKSFWLGAEDLGELPTDLKAGDIVKFKVIGKDAQGNVEFVFQKGGDEGGDQDDLRADLESSMPASMGGTYGEANE